MSRGSVQLVPLRKPKKPSVIGAQSWKGKGTKDPTEGRGGTGPRRPYGLWKDLASALCHWAAIWEGLVEGREAVQEAFGQSTPAVCGEGLGGGTYSVEANSEGPIMPICFLAWLGFR